MSSSKPLAPADSSSAILAPCSKYINELVFSGPIPDTCSICLEKIDDKHPAVQINNVSGCTHSFGKDCLTQWLKGASTCPMCRAKLYHGEPQHLAWNEEVVRLRQWLVERDPHNFRGLQYWRNPAVFPDSGRPANPASRPQYPRARPIDSRDWIGPDWNELIDQRSTALRLQAPRARVEQEQTGRAGRSSALQFQ